MVQPPHFIAEVAAVLARLKPDFSQDDLFDLLHIEHQTLDTAQTYATAVRLAIRHQHPLFDTLYHAVALQMQRLRNAQGKGSDGPPLARSSYLRLRRCG